MITLILTTILLFVHSQMPNLRSLYWNLKIRKYCSYLPFQSSFFLNGHIKIIYILPVSINDFEKLLVARE